MDKMVAIYVFEGTTDFPAENHKYAKPAIKASNPEANLNTIS